MRASDRRVLHISSLDVLTNFIFLGGRGGTAPVVKCKVLSK